MTATVTSKGQITIPVEIRRALGLRTGSRVAFIRTPSGSYELVPEISTIKALKGAVTKPPRPVGIDEMDTAVAAAAARSMSQ